MNKQDSIIATAIAMRMDRGCGKRMKGEGGKCVPAGSRLAQGMNNAVSSGDWSAAQKFGGQIVANENRLAQARRKKFRQSAGNAFRGTASALNRSADVIQKTAATAIAAKTLHELSKRNQEKKDSLPKATCGKGWTKGAGKCVRNKSDRTLKAIDDYENTPEFKAENERLEKEAESFMNENMSIRGKDVALLAGATGAATLIGIGGIAATEKAKETASNLYQGYKAQRDRRRAEQELKEALKKGRKADSLYIATAIAMRMNA